MRVTREKSKYNLRGIRIEVKLDHYYIFPLLPSCFLSYVYSLTIP